MRDKEYVTQQSYAMLWREAVYRGIRLDTNRELLYARMFPKSEDGLSLLKMQLIADVPTAGYCNGCDAVQPKTEGSRPGGQRKRAAPEEDEEEDEVLDFELEGEGSKL